MAKFIFKDITDFIDKPSPLGRAYPTSEPIPPLGTANPNDKQDPITLPEKDSAEDDIKIYMQFLKEHEGKKLTAYKPIETEKYYTIGYGHYDEDIKEGMTITEEQANNYLKEDINVRLPEIKKAIPGFDKMPLEVRKNILGSWFRGSIKPNHNTVKLINKGKFKEASKEFLNHAEYKKYKSKPGTMDGVVNRMEDTAKAIASLSL
jgi:GH24 family phage-related lysozyme (muramidase)